MKIIVGRSLVALSLVLFFLSGCSRPSPRAHVNRGAATTTTTVGTGGGSSATDSSPNAVLSRGPNSRVFGTVTLETNGPGRVTSRTNIAYTELASGLHFRRNGQWIPTREQIVPLPQGSSFAAAATNGPHQVWFPADIYQAGILTVASDTKRLTCRPTAISYFDGTNEVLFAEVTNSLGQILPSGNQVIYTNCFPGLADLLCTYRKGGLECDLVFRARPIPPEQLNFDPRRCRIRLWTEWFDTPDPIARDAALNPADDLSDSILDFGAVRLAHGRTFSTPQSRTSRLPEFPVYKTWQKVDNRTFLTEEVPFRHLAQEMLDLGFLDRRSNEVELARATINQDSPFPVSPPKPAASRATNEMLLAKADLSHVPGLALDFTELNDDTTPTSYTFEPQTYWISDIFYVSGLTTIRGGAVIKFPEDAYWLIIADHLTCATGPYRCAVLTSENDDTAGETLPWSTHTPAKGNTVYLGVQSAYADLKYLRFAYAGAALQAYTGSPDIWHSQFLDSQIGVAVDSGGEARFHNVLFSSCGKLTDGDSVVRAEHLSVDNTDLGFISGTNAFLTNCLLTRLVSPPPPPGTNEPTVKLFSSTNGVFQCVGGGNFYTSAQFANLGTTAISSNLLRDLKLKTTFPPVLLANTVLATNNVTLSPQVERMTGNPSLGFTYDPIDFEFGAVIVTNPVTVTVTPGTVIAGFGSNGVGRAFTVANAQFLAQGTATQPVRIVEYNTVQERTPTNWNIPFYCLITDDIYEDNFPPPAYFNCRFTDFSSLGLEVPNFGALGSPCDIRDCQSHGGYFFAYARSTFTNCLFDGGQSFFYPQNNAPTVIQNALFRGGQFNFVTTEFTNGTIADVLFDRTEMYYNDWITAGGHNAFVTNYGRINPTNATDIIITNTSYASGPLGDSYYSGNGIGGLMNAGTTNANLLGLYHYTTLTNLSGGNEIRESNSIVEVGFHYIATDSSGIPIDDDGDGVASYREDANGDGIYNPGDLANWNSTDTDGDGVPDNMEILQGRNPRVAGTVADTNNIINLRVYTPLK